MEPNFNLNHEGYQILSGGQPVLLKRSDDAGSSFEPVAKQWIVTHLKCVLSNS